MKRLLEKYNKLSLYFSGNINEYISYGLDKNTNPIITTAIGFFPLDYTKTLTGNLFEKFDKNGIPLKYLHGGYLYFHTKTFTYATACWNVYLTTGNKDCRQNVIKVGDYILNAVQKEETGWYFRDDIGEGNFTGKYSGAMEQGLSAFILACCYDLTKEKKYYDATINVIEPLFHSNHGMRLTINNNLWFDEFVGTGRHVLNGFCDAVFGLYYAYKLTSDIKYKNEFLNAIDSLVNLLPLYDRGYWSNYWYAPKLFPYIASMKYHSVHIHQLRALAALSNNDKLLFYANKFEGYTRNKGNIAMAAMQLLIGKIQIKRAKVL